MADSTPIFLSLYSDKEISEEQYQQELIKEFGGRVNGFDAKYPLGKKSKNTARDLKKCIARVFIKSRLSTNRFSTNSDKAKKTFIDKVLESSTINPNTLSMIKAAPDAKRHRDLNTTQFALIVNACVDVLNDICEAMKPIVLYDRIAADYYADTPLSNKSDYQKRCWVVCAFLDVDTREELNRSKIEELSEQLRRERTATIGLIAIYASLLGSDDLEHLWGNTMRAGQLHYNNRMLDEDGTFELRKYAVDHEYIEEDLDEPEDYISEEDFLKLLKLATEKRDLTLVQYLFAAIIGDAYLWPGIELRDIQIGLAALEKLKAL